MNARAIASTSVPAQLTYLAEDKELAALMWQIAALPEDARLILRMMVAHLAQAQDRNRRSG